MITIHITSLGCPKNTVDSEVLGGQLLNQGYILSDHPESSDITIINTCGFIQDAKEESINAIFEAIEIKKKDENKRVFVIGCLAQRYRNEIVKEIPEIDGIFGIEDYQNILNTLGENNFDLDNIYNKRKLSTPDHYAYLKISEGCNRNCSFCTIPSIKGAYRSRTIDSILSEAEILAKSGVKELIVVSQDNSYYGIDLDGKQKIIDLLTKIAESGIFQWIRPLYWYPTNLLKEFMTLIEKYHCIIPYLDLPVQHVSNKILSSMKRADSKNSLIKLFSKIRVQIPEISLRTSFIIGYPGEKEEDFNKLIYFIKKIRFNHVGVFLYSDEEGTESFTLSQKVNRNIALNRKDKLMKIQQKISYENNNKLINTYQKVLIDSYNHTMKYYSGRTYRDAPEIDNEVIISSKIYDPDLVGSFKDIKIIDASEYELYGEYVSQI